MSYAEVTDVQGEFKDLPLTTTSAIKTATVERFLEEASALIDATLYDKIDGICDRRSIKTLNFSVLELNRVLVRNPTIRKRYFPDS